MGERNGHALDPHELLLADLEHFGEALHRNEEMGEKRLVTDEFKATIGIPGAYAAPVAGLVAVVLWTFAAQRRG